MLFIWQENRAVQIRLLELAVVWFCALAWGSSVQCTFVHGVQSVQRAYEFRQADPAKVTDHSYFIMLYEIGAGILEQSMGARNLVGIGLAHRPARAGICKSFKEPRNRFPAWQACTTTLFVVPARHAT